ncbi:MAG TPA: hypothetical protein VMS17_13485 [Gemmataceae bacterium]|nr:hypothetical protein [Gemmataceae bacterium]
MPRQDKGEARRTALLNGFLARWRRNASHAGLVAAALALLVAAFVVFALCACGIVGSGQTFPPSR